MRALVMLLKLQTVHLQSVFIQGVPNLLSSRSSLHMASISVGLLIPSSAF